MTYQTDAKLPDPSIADFLHPAIGQEGWRAWFKPSNIYVIASGRDERPVKIGYAQDVVARIKAFEAGNPYGLRAVQTFETFTGIARQVERRIHGVFADKALGREWFDLAAHEAAEVIPYWCDLGRRALEHYRDRIETEDAAGEKAGQDQQNALALSRAVTSARAAMALHRLSKLSAAPSKPQPPETFDAKGARNPKLARYKAARGIID